MTQHENNTSLSMETILVHGGKRRRADSSLGTPTIPPIYTSTTYLHQSAEAMDQAFNGKQPDGEQAFVYARQNHVNATLLEDVLAGIEHGVGAVAFGSGMAAIHAALLTAGLTTGTKIVASKDLYGPSIGILQKVFQPVGVEIVLADLCCPQAPDLILAEQPDVVFVETISNPLVRVADLDALSTAARSVGATTIIDSTFTTPYLVRPIEHGFDLVVHSATKYIGGHGDSTGGIVISSKNTLQDQLRTFSMLLGAMLSPFDAHIMLRGLRTLTLRIRKQCENALQVAHFLAQHPKVATVYYPGLAHHPQHQLASKLLDHELYGALLAFEIKEQTRAAAFRFMDSLQLCLPATTLGDIFSLVSYPAISSHRTLTEEERKKMGITEGCVRLSVGIESVDDIIADLDQALSK